MTLAFTWTDKSLEELVVNGDISYGIVQPGVDSPSGVPIVRVKDIRSGRIDQRSPLRVRPQLSDRYRRTLLEGGELLVSIVGTVGESAVVPKEMAGWNVARAVAVVRPLGVSADWIRLCLETSAVKHALAGVLNTTVQSTLNLADLKRLAIPVPPPAEREAIVEVLGALDDKIAANAKLVESAGSLSAATFASMLTATDSMPLTAVASFINGKAFTKNATGTGRVVIRIAELNSGIGGSTVYNDLDVPEQHLARPGDLLFAWSGSLTLHRWYRPEGIVNQHIFKVFPTAGYPMWCVHRLIARKLDEFKSIAADKATTMGHIQRRHLDEPVNVPSQSKIRSHDAVMSALWERALAAEQESLTLEATRDALLPQLMSGKIRVKAAEKSVGEAL